MVIPDRVRAVPIARLTGPRCSVIPMQGHLPVPPQPHFPVGLSPVIGYIATREPQPLEEREPVEREWWETESEEEWPSRQPRVIRVTAIVVSASLLLAGIGTILGEVLGAH
jgi:hypothetical protein